MSGEFKVAVCQSRKARYVRYPVDNVTNLTGQPRGSKLREKVHLDHSQIPVWFYPFLEVD